MGSKQSQIDEEFEAISVSDLESGDFTRIIFFLEEHERINIFSLRKLLKYKIDILDKFMLLIIKYRRKFKVQNHHDQRKEIESCCNGMIKFLIDINASEETLIDITKMFDEAKLCLLISLSVIDHPDFIHLLSNTDQIKYQASLEVLEERAHNVFPLSPSPPSSPSSVVLNHSNTNSDNISISGPLIDLTFPQDTIEYRSEGYSYLIN